MLVNSRARRAVLHLPARLLSTRPTPNSRHKVTRLRLSSHSVMLKKAVANHEAAAQQKALAKQLFSSSPVAPQPSAQSRPLSNGSANVVRPNATHSGLNGNGTHAGVKRNASGLAKALSGQDAFEERQYPELNGTRKGSGTTTEEVFFDENDFESDIDLDVEDLVTKGIVSYPKLPAQPSASQLNVTPTVPRQAPHVTTSISPDDPGYQSIINAKYSPASNQVDLTTPLPWSSSPLEHFKQPNNEQFACEPLAPDKQVAAQAKLGKRRTLPWLIQQQVPRPTEPTYRAESAQSVASRNTHSPEALTPLPKNDSKEQYPWNTTASAIKAQQKKLREANKRLTKTHEATEETKLEANSKKKKVPKVFLSEEQRHILKLVIERKSVFFTGSAGTGKSVLLREIIFALKKKFNQEPDRIAVTASTGLAACNIGGVTLHSFAGIGLGKEVVPQLVRKIKRNQKARQRWLRTKVLIVDEISMVDGELFDKLEEIARTIRNDGRPFGGIQVVITGDFFQLPPVPDDPRRFAKFCFDASSWNTVVEHTIGLKQVFRQKDPGKTIFLQGQMPRADRLTRIIEFATMLNELREGRLTHASISKFRSLSRPLHFSDDLEATELFPTRAEVDEANMKRMLNIQGETHTYEARDSGTITEKSFRDKLLTNCMAPEVIMLKKGAQVMLIKNVDDTLVNGSLGKVIGFMSEATFDNYQQNEEEYYATQVNPEEEGPAELSERKLKIEELMASTAQVYPIVRFILPDGTTRDLLAQRETWKVELPSGEVQACRSQIPLILAWALSIHKAQGQTLERVKVDLRKVFEKGQAYVALSRATSMTGLQVMSFDPSKVLAHDRVRSFYAGLSRVQKEKEERENGRPEKKAKMTKGGVSAMEYEDSLMDMPLEGPYDSDSY